MDLVEIESIARAHYSGDLESARDLIAGRDTQALLEAIRCGRKPVADWLMAKGGVAANSRGRNGESLLHAAAAAGDCDLVLWLIGQGHVPRWTLDSDGRTALHAACGTGQFSAARVLVDRLEFSPHDQDNDGCTALGMAVSAGSLEIVQWLVSDHLADPEPWLGWQGKAITVAALKGDLDLVKWLVTKAGAIPTSGRANLTLAQAAAWSGNQELLHWLAKVAGVNLRELSLSGAGTIHFAARSGNLELVRWLLEREALECFKEFLTGRSVIHYAAESGSLPLVEWLAKTGHGEIEATDESLRLPLHYACMSGNRFLVDWLLTQSRRQHDQGDDEGVTPMHFACEWGHSAVAKHLISSGFANPRRITKYHQTALHFASGAGSPTLVRFLTHDCGLNPIARDAWEQTAVHYALSAKPRILPFRRSPTVATAQHLEAVRVLTSLHPLGEYVGQTRSLHHDKLLKCALVGGFLPLVRLVVDTMGVDHCLAQDTLVNIMKNALEAGDTDVLRFLLDVFEKPIAARRHLWAEVLDEIGWNKRHLHLVPVLKGSERFGLGRASAKISDSDLLHRCLSDRALFRSLIEDSGYDLASDLQLIRYAKRSSVKDGDLEFRSWLVTAFPRAAGPFDETQSPEKGLVQ